MKEKLNNENKLKGIIWNLLRCDLEVDTTILPSRAELCEAVDQDHQGGTCGKL
jgi:hypothetical protein